MAPAAAPRLDRLERKRRRFDQFGVQLAAQRTVGEQQLLTASLRLPLWAPALATVGTDIQTWIQTAEFLEAGLVDHMHVVVVPLLLGRGVRLWDGREP